jgi:prepilin-type processing-associated H-X9-DG protein
VDYFAAADATDDGTDVNGHFVRRGPVRKGVIETRKSRRMRDVIDGTSNTMLLAECAGLPSRYPRFRQASADRTHFLNVGPWAGHVGGANALILRGWEESGYGQLGGNGVVNRTNDTAGNVFSFHEGGAMIALCDGSVRLVSEYIDGQIVRLLVDIDDGEVIGEF